MAFKIIKQWLFSGLRRSRSRAGQLVVTGEGEAMIVVNFEPESVLVYFTDPEPPIDPCNPHDPDILDFNLQFLGFGRWAVKIEWQVFSIRHIKYEVEGSI